MKHIIFSVRFPVPSKPYFGLQIHSGGMFTKMELYYFGDAVCKVFMNFYVLKFFFQLEIIKETLRDLSKQSISQDDISSGQPSDSHGDQTEVHSNHSNPSSVHHSEAHVDFNKVNLLNTKGDLSTVSPTDSLSNFSSVYSLDSQDYLQTGHSKGYQGDNSTVQPSDSQCDLNTVHSLDEQYELLSDDSSDNQEDSIP